jgi:hypothetical protein
MTPSDEALKLLVIASKDHFGAIEANDLFGWAPERWTEAYEKSKTFAPLRECLQHGWLSASATPMREPTHWWSLTPAGRSHLPKTTH